jgi:hypothetical protein
MTVGEYLVSISTAPSGSTALTHFLNIETGDGSGETIYVPTTSFQIDVVDNILDCNLDIISLDTEFVSVYLESDFVYTLLSADLIINKLDGDLK